jgi:hypothetical protein
MKNRMPKQDERKVNMTTTLFLRENGAVTMSIVQKEGSFREVWKIDGLGENRKIKNGTIHAKMPNIRA